MDKKKSLIIGVVLFLIGFIIGFVGFNVYDKFVNKNDNVVNEKSDENDDLSDVNSYLSYEIVEGIDENGNGISELYVNDKLVEFEGQGMTYATIKVEKFDNEILIVEKSLASSTLFVVNSDAEVIGVFAREENDYYKETNKITIKANYRDTYRIAGNTIYIQSDVFGNGGADWMLCNDDKYANEAVIYEEKFEYLGNNEFSDSVVTMTITGKEYMTENNINCDKYE